MDIVGGSLANLAATYVAWKIGRRNIHGAWVIATASEILLITAIVGSYLSYLFQMPLEVGLSGIFLGSFVATGILGFILLLLISRPVITQQLESHGLITYRKTEQKESLLDRR